MFARHWAAKGAALLAVGWALTLLGVQTAGAVSVQVFCPGTVVTTDREFSVTTNPGTAVCLASAPGNLNGNNDVINQMGYITLDKSDDLVTGALPGALTATPPTSGLSGSFSISAPGYGSLVLALKSGNGVLNPDWAAFLLPAGVTSGTWTISGAQQLSHFNLYGKVSPVPLPAALPLFAAALAGTGLLGWRKRGKTA
jgi:hypothetical protein